MTTSNAGGDAEKLRNGTIHRLLVGPKNDKTTLEHHLIVLIKLGMELPYNLAIALLGIYPVVIKIYVHTKPCT